MAARRRGDGAQRAGAGLDASVPNIARMNDYFLGGKDNFAADRAAAEAILTIAPEIKVMARENRAFAGRVVRYLAGQGIRQFIDIGAGLPTRNNTHQGLRSIVPDASVVYVENDPMVLSHARALLAPASRTAVVEGNVLGPEALLRQDRLRELIDLERPVAVLIFGALHFVPDEDKPFDAVARLRDALVPGSHLALSHLVFDSRPEAALPIVDIYRKVMDRTEDASRTRMRALPFFDGFDLLEPGLVHVRQWRPDNPMGDRPPHDVWLAGGVGRKPGATSE